MKELQRLVRPVTGHTLQAYGSGSGKHLVKDDDIVCSAWKHAAELKARLDKLRYPMNTKDFSSVISTKKLLLKDLEGYKNPLLVITDMDKMLGFKRVFQTQLTRDTVNERIRCPVGMWDISETFINNDIQLVLDRLHSYYK